MRARALPVGDNVRVCIFCRTKQGSRDNYYCNMLIVETMDNKSNKKTTNKPVFSDNIKQDIIFGFSDRWLLHVTTA